MRWLHSHPVPTTLLAFAVAGGTVVAIAAAFGFGAFADAWSNLHFAWLALAICAVFLGMAAYILCYRIRARQARVAGDRG